MINFKHILVFVFFFNSLLTNSFSTEIINNKTNLSYLTLETKDKDKYSFLVAGHIYGAPGPSHYPAASFMANIDKIKNSNFSFMFLLGDTIQHGFMKDRSYGVYDLKNIRKINEIEYEIFDKTIVKKLNKPIFPIPGNHDLGDEVLYKEKFGELEFSFKNKSEAFININTSALCMGKNSIFTSKLDSYAKDKNIKNIFIMMHHVLFHINNKKIHEIKRWASGSPENCANYENEIVPKINQIAKNKNIYMFAGDVGCKDYKLGVVPVRSFPIFYHKEKDRNLYYLATGICEHLNDNYLNIEINNGNVFIEPISLSGQVLKNIENYNFNFWKNHFSNFETELKEPEIKKSLIENIKLKTYSIIKKTISLFKRKVLYVGIFLGIFFSIFIYLIFNQKKKIYHIDR